MTIIGSRNKFCINKKALAEKDVNQACMDLLKGLDLNKTNTTQIKPVKSKIGSCCSMFNRSSKLSSTLSSVIHDVEDLLEEGRELNACPYYAAREMSENAEVIFAPYNYLIDPVIRDTVGIKLDGCIVIIDEAHNIEDSSRESGSLKITRENLDGSIYFWKLFFIYLAILNELLGLVHHNKLENGVFVSIENDANVMESTKYFTQHASLLTVNHLFTIMSMLIISL